MANLSPPRTAGPQVELEIESLAYEGAAVARLEGRVIFVDGGAPGDRVLAEIVGERKNLAQARVLAVLRPSPSRVQAPCPVADRCGGCDWQHVDYAAQLEAKRQIIVDALERNAKIREPAVAAVLPSLEAYGYRNRIRLHVDDGRLSYYERRSRRAVVVTDCLIAEDRIRTTMPAVTAFVRSLSTTARQVELAARGELPGVVLSIECSGRLHGVDVRRVLGIIGDSSNAISGVTMFGPRWHRVWGDMRRQFSTGEPPVSIELIDTAFGQVNTAANRILVRQVLDVAALCGTERVWDLYAGAGNLSLPLARGAREVVAVERDVGAIAAARTAAAQNGLENLTFHALPVEEHLARDATIPDLIVLNPPRVGVGDHAARIADRRVPRIIYVSCNPPTLARDVAVLAGRGYRLHVARPVDLFPQTCRVETVCELLLT